MSARVGHEEESPETLPEGGLLEQAMPLASRIGHERIHRGACHHLCKDGRQPRVSGEVHRQTLVPVPGFRWNSFLAEVQRKYPVAGVDALGNWRLQLHFAAPQ